MALLKVEQDVLHVGKRILQKDSQEEERKQVESFMTLRRHSAANFKQKLLDQSLQVLGDDPHTIAERQSRDQESVAKFLETQKQKALAQSGRVNSRQQSEIAERLNRRNKVKNRKRVRTQHLSASTYNGH